MTKHITRMEIDDAEHFTPEERQAIIDAIQSTSARRAPKVSRAWALVACSRSPRMQSSAIRCRSPNHWYQIIGVDFGWEHPFAATRNAWDKDNDVWYVCASYRESKTTPPIHYAAIMPWGDWIPCAWPHDGLQHDKGSGNELASHYKKLGLKMLDEHATHASGGMGIEAGITEMLERMQTGRFKVFRGQEQWMEEFRYYRREEGLIVKERDDLISSTRYAIMMRRSARQSPYVARVKPRRKCSAWAA